MSEKLNVERFRKLRVNPKASGQNANELNRIQEQCNLDADVYAVLGLILLYLPISVDGKKCSDIANALNASNGNIDEAQRVAAREVQNEFFPTIEFRGRLLLDCLKENEQYQAEVPQHQRTLESHLENLRREPNQLDPLNYAVAVRNVEKFLRTLFVKVEQADEMSERQIRETDQFFLDVELVANWFEHAVK